MLTNTIQITKIHSKSGVLLTQTKQKEEIIMARQCNSCNHPLGDQDCFCPNCGSSNPVEAPQQPVYQPPAYEQPTYQQPNYQPPAYPQPNYQQPAYQQPSPILTQPQEVPMKWFKFIIWVQLFLAALSNLGTGIQGLFGLQYNMDAELIYQVFPDLKVADTIYGIALILLAVYCIIIRFRLSGYHKDGPMLYLIMLGCNIAFPIIYNIMVTSAMAPYDSTDIWTNGAANIVGAAIMLVCNSVYFNKRKHLFIK